MHTKSSQGHLSHLSYDEYLDEKEEDTLKIRREKLCLNFAESCIKDDKFCNWFTKGVCTRKKTIFMEPEAKTGRYRNSAIPH